MASQFRKGGKDFRVEKFSLCSKNSNAGWRKGSAEIMKRHFPMQAEMAILILRDDTKPNSEMSHPCNKHAVWRGKKQPLFQLNARRIINHPARQKSQVSLQSRTKLQASQRCVNYSKRDEVALRLFRLSLLCCIESQQQLVRLCR